LLLIGFLAAGCILVAGVTHAQSGVSPTGSIGGFEAKFIDVNGVRTRYYDAGEGEPLVLMHGSSWRGTANANTWTAVMPELSQHYRVIAPDGVGAGMTDNPLKDEDYNMQGMVKHLLEFIEVMDLGPIHLMGQSTGGAIVFLAAVERPEIIKTLIIVNSQPAAPRVGPTGRDEALAPCREIDEWIPQWKCVHSALSYDDSHLNEELFAAGAYMESQPKVQVTHEKREAGAGKPHFFSREGTEWIHSVHERVRNEGMLQMPVLLYWSRNDPNSALGSPGAKEVSAFFDVIAEKNPRVRLLMTNKAGHFHYRENPQEFNWNVINFIEYWNSQ
jgi:pimeloyl-ACP methyl ester carboxylesterase